MEEDINAEVRRIVNALQDYAKIYKCPAMSVYALQFNLFYSDNPFFIFSESSFQNI